MKAVLISSLLAVGVGTTAMAAPVSVNYYSGSELSQLDSTFYSDFGMSTLGFAVEDFEDGASLGGTYENGETIASGTTTEGEITEGTSITSSVGSFTAVTGATGSGSTCARQDLNNDGCTNVAYQASPSQNGQGNTIPFDGNYAINTADTNGLVWNVSTDQNGGMFDTLVFVIRDAADAGQRSLSIEGDGFSFTDTRLSNENLLLFEVTFDTPQTSAEVTIETSRNDAFTFDGAAVGMSVVPLPAAAWMLLAGLCGLFGLRRFKTV